MNAIFGQPLVSVIVPVYNAERGIARCIESILNQSLRDIELILVDDGSSDRSGTICDEYAVKDARISVVHKANEGVAATRMVGINLAKGEYSIQVDADDWVEPTMLEELYQKAKQEARKMAERVKIWFEELPVYTSFSSPHWICRVGDFQTRDEAMEVLQAMRESGRFPKAIIVKSKINITEDELRREESVDSCATRDTTAYNTNIGIAGRGPAEGGTAKDSTACCQGHD